MMAGGEEIVLTGYMLLLPRPVSFLPFILTSIPALPHSPLFFVTTPQYILMPLALTASEPSSLEPLLSVSDTTH